MEYDEWKNKVMADKINCIGYCLLLRQEVPLALAGDGAIVCFYTKDDSKQTIGQVTNDGVIITKDKIYLSREVSDEEWEWIKEKQEEKF